MAKKKDKSPEWKRYKERLIAYFKKRGFTQKMVAEMMECSPQNVNNFHKEEQDQDFTMGLMQNFKLKNPDLDLNFMVTGECEAKGSIVYNDDVCTVKYHNELEKENEKLKAEKLNLEKEIEKLRSGIQEITSEYIFALKEDNAVLKKLVNRNLPVSDNRIIEPTPKQEDTISGRNRDSSAVKSVKPLRPG